MNLPQVPELVRKKALSRGAAGRDWLAGLPDLLAAVSREFGLVAGRVLDGGSESYVAEVRLRSEELAVLKLGMPGGGSFAAEIRTLRAAGGSGYVRLLESDESRRIMVQERLGPSLRSLHLPVPVALERICAALLRTWQVRPPEELRTGADAATGLAGFIAETWQELGQPCPDRLIEQAVSFARLREAAYDPGGCVLVHGDAHDANALQDPAAPDRVKFVDPDAMRGDRAYDLGVLMREFNAELLAGDARRLCLQRCEHLSRLTGVDPEPIWQWGFIERISTGLYALQIGADDLGRQMLGVAEALSP